MIYCNDWIWGCDEKELVENSSRISIGIYYKDINWAKNLYNKLVTYFRYTGCLAHACYTKCVNEFFILLKNGTSYKFVRIDNISRGQKFQNAYIEDGISDDDINEYVIPNLRLYRDVFKVVKN